MAQGAGHCPDRYRMLDLCAHIRNNRSMSQVLPIDEILPDLIETLRTHQRAVLQAPPGAGKTTRVPLAMRDAGLCKGRILMLEPRRLAARAAAERMAATLGEKVGQTVGYRIRGEAKTSAATQIEVVTEGILTRMLQSNPDLPNIGAVLFDEFHERSLNSDFGLALCLEVADALRDDLILLAMSATLDAGPVARLMNAALLTSEGRSFPVETRWLKRPLPPKSRKDIALADLVVQAEWETRKPGGAILAFLPGEGEIRRAERSLKSRLPAYCELLPLYGALPFAEQRKALEPIKTGRKVVLATSIAETSLTIPDVRVVIDMGLARRARFDPGSGMSRLVTEKVTRAEATQRSGRAGRVAEGVCYRLWTKGEEGALSAFPPAEIESSDLTGLALELAMWGAEASELPFLTPPPQGALAEAQTLLHQLDALDTKGRITDHGRKLAKRPLHPRLAHMLERSGPKAAPLAALLSERDPLRGAPADLSLRVEALRDPDRFTRERPFQLDRGTLSRIRAEAKRLGGDPKPARMANWSSMVAQAYPDRIGQRRKGDTPRYILSGGKGAVLPDADPMTTTPFLVALDTDGNLREAKIRLAAQISLSDIVETFQAQIEWQDTCLWSRRDRRVEARRRRMFGALSLEDRLWKDAPDDEIAKAMLEGVRELGFRFSPAAERLRLRVALLRQDGHDLPDFSEAGLMATLEDWLLPMLSGVRTAQEWKSFDLMPALQAALTWEQSQLLDREAPGSYRSPLGRKIPIEYTDDGPAISVRLQELFGETHHPSVGSKALRITLLSPAQRPIQITQDLPGFWAGSYADVRKDMRAQYPKHPWPEDPTIADPTLRAKRRK